MRYVIIDSAGRVQSPGTIIHRADFDRHLIVCYRDTLAQWALVWKETQWEHRTIGQWR